MFFDSSSEVSTSKSNINKSSASKITIKNDLTDESIKYGARVQLINQKTELIFRDWIKQLRDQSFIDIRLIQD